MSRRYMGMDIIIVILRRIYVYKYIYIILINYKLSQFMFYILVYLMNFLQNTGVQILFFYNLVIYN